MSEGDGASYCRKFNCRLLGNIAMPLTFVAFPDVILRVPKDSRPIITKEDYLLGKGLPADMSSASSLMDLF